MGSEPNNVEATANEDTPLRARVLVVDDEPSIRSALGEVLAEERYAVVEARDGLEAIAKLESESFDVVVTDLRMPGADGLEVLRAARQLNPQTLVILVTAFASLETAVEALRQGAHDYILKPILFDDLLAKLDRLLEHRRLAWETQALRREVEGRFDLDRMLVGRSPGIRAIAEVISRVAPTRSTVLITGESGVGKEVVARAIHRASAFAKGSFLPVNCSAIPENLIEAELFGYAKGAFTGAAEAKEGLFQRASQGTIFLDEIGDMPLDLQSKLLRVLEAKEVLPLGTGEPVPVDVRILAATNRNLEREVADGRFREDLFYRLNVVSIQVPALRERREDIPELVEFLVRRHNRELNRQFHGVEAEAMRALMAHPWDGNIRELENAIQHAMILGESEWIHVVDLPRAIAPDGASQVAVGDRLRDAVRAFEKSHIENVLRRHDGDKRKAAKALGTSLSSLYRKIDELGVST